MAMRPAAWLLLSLLSWHAPGATAAPGSWVAEAPAVRLAVPGRVYQSAALSAPRPELVAGAEIDSVRWRFELPSGRRVRAWLCRAGHCVALPGQRGRSRGLAGLAASRDLRFRFALPPGERRALPVRALQVVVNYRGGVQG